MTKRDSTLRHFLSQPRRLPPPEMEKEEQITSEENERELEA
jgi:hypothetical protein